MPSQHVVLSSATILATRSRSLDLVQAMRALPFCRNWNTMVATSNLSGFLSGCHVRRSARNSLSRSGFDCSCLMARSLVRASFLACCNSSDSSPAASSPSSGPPLSLSFRLFELLLEELLLERFFVDLRFFFRSLDRLLELELLLELDELFSVPPAPAAPCAAFLAIISARITSRMDRDPS